MKKIYSISLVIFSLAVTFSGCDYKAESLGSDQRIFVFVDSLIWQDIKEDVEETFHDYVFTPRAEKSFILNRTSLNKLNGFKGRKNLLFIGTTDTQNEVNDYLKQVVPQQFRDDVNQDKSFYFFKDDLFVRDQISLFMIAKDSESFLKNFSLLKEDILKRFNEKYFTRLETGMFEKGEQFEIEEFLEENYGYKIKVQHDYFIANQEPKEKYTWIRRIDPDRWISIWRKGLNDVGFSRDSLFNIRNEMTKKYYDGDYIVLEETEINQQLFQGKPTTKISGTWRNDSLIVGGPFRTYVIPREKEDAVYFIDIAVMAPSMDKKPYLDQLEVIANTFQFVDKETVNK